LPALPNKKDHAKEEKERKLFRQLNDYLVYVNRLELDGGLRERNEKKGRRARAEH